MEVSGLNRLLALAGEIGTGSSRIQKVSARDLAESTPSSRAAQPGDADTGFQVSLSARAQAITEANRTPAPAAPQSTPPAESGDDSKGLASPEIASEATTHGHARGGLRRSAFAAYHRVEASDPGTQIRIRV